MARIPDHALERGKELAAKLNAEIRSFEKELTDLGYTTFDDARSMLRCLHCHSLVASIDRESHRDYCGV